MGRYVRCGMAKAMRDSAPASRSCEVIGLVAPSDSNSIRCRLQRDDRMDHRLPSVAPLVVVRLCVSAFPPFGVHANMSSAVSI